MTVLALLTEKQTFFDANSNELSGGKLFVYLAGTNTKATTYAETDGLSANSNPIVLNSRGEVPNGLYVAGGATYKLVLAPATDTDPPTSPIWTRDNLIPINDVTAASATEWVSSAVVATQINATQFSVPGDQRTTFQVGRRVQAASTAGTRYGTVSVASFGAGITTITLSPLSGNLDAGLTGTTPSVGLLTSTNPSVPEVADNVFRIPNSADRTKETRFDSSVLPTGITRVLYPALPSSVKTSGPYALIEADYGGVIYCSSSFTINLTTTLGAGFQVWVKNTGTGVITLAPSSGVLFFPGAANAGAASVTLPYSGAVEGPYNVSGVLLQCDGTNWHVVATDEAHGEQLLTSSGTWTAPAGVTTIWLDGAAQGGGGGGVGTTAGSSAGGGGGGQSIVGSRFAVVPGTAYTVTLANSGGAGGVGNANGTAGSNAVFGALVTLTGGTGGTGSSGGSPVAGGAAGGAGGSAGGSGFNITGSTSTGGEGGGTHWGQGGARTFGTVGGNAASGYGAGGSGAVQASGASQTGGAGSAGFFRVRW